MSTVDDEPVLELDELLDSSRLAAAWQVAHERAAEEAEAVEAAAPAAPDEAPAAAAPAASATAPAASAPAASPTPPIPPPLPVAVAHHVLLDELARLRSTSPELAAQAEAVLAVPLAQLAAALDPLDATAAEKLLDDLEDLLQSLLITAGWPTAGEE